MGFAYGQIIKNEGFVRKFERDLGLITDKQFQNSTLSVIPSRRTDWACAAFGKSSAVYGQIIKNESFVRKSEWGLASDYSYASLYLSKKACSIRKPVCLNIFFA